MAVLSLPVVVLYPEYAPINVLCGAVVTSAPARCPTAVQLVAVVASTNTPEPTPTLA